MSASNASLNNTSGKGVNAWESLEGTATSPITALSWGPKRIDLFMNGTDNAVLHKWWDSSKWNGWESLGGTATSPVTALSWEPKRIDLFMNGTDNAVLHKWWDSKKWSP